MRTRAGTRSEHAGVEEAKPTQLPEPDQAENHNTKSLDLTLLLYLVSQEINVSITSYNERTARNGGSFVSTP
ncbi:hypothetical protein H7X68_03570 [Candidatus Saccharibacteria bacterium]|nr:hypothetical protein [Candidatus Saccharibacteria bacterium]